MTFTIKKYSFLGLIPMALLVMHAAIDHYGQSLGIKALAVIVAVGLFVTGSFLGNRLSDRLIHYFCFGTWYVIIAFISSNIWISDWPDGAFIAFCIIQVFPPFALAPAIALMLRKILS